MQIRSTLILPALISTLTSCVTTTPAMPTGNGGASGSGGNGDGKVCPLPTTFKWTSTDPLAEPKTGWVAIKDFSSVVYNNQHIVYMSTVDSSGSYGGALMTFADWAQAATVTQSAISVGGVAPTLF